MKKVDAIARDRDLCLGGIAEIGTLSGWESKSRCFLEKRVNTHFKRLRKLRSLTQRGRRTSASALQTTVLHSYGGRLCATLIEHLRRRPLLPLSIADLEYQAAELDLYSRCSEPVRVWTEPKANGSFRPLLAPGPRMRRRVRLLRHVLDARFGIDPHDFSAPARGRDAAAQRVKQMIESEGVRSLVVFDLANYFPSVKPTHLKEFHLPEKVIQHTLLFNRGACIFHHGNMVEAKAVRQGLPQGATTSGKIASALLGRELQKLSGGKRKVIYVDDGVIGACAPPDAIKIAKALEERLANLIGGPLSFKKLEIADAAKGFAFLGYWFRAVMEGDDCKTVLIKPSHAAFKRCERRLMHKLQKGACDWDSAIQIANNYIAGWLLGFSLWQPTEIETCELECRVLSWIEDWHPVAVK